MEKTTAHRIFNVGSDAGTSLNRLIELMSGVTGRRVEPVYAEDPVVRVQKVALDVSRIRDDVGWKPSTSLQEGIERT